MAHCLGYLNKFINVDIDCEFRFEYLKDLIVCIYNDENLTFDELGSCEERIQKVLQSLDGLEAQDIFKNRKPHKQKTNLRNKNRKIINPADELEELKNILETLQSKNLKLI